MSKLQPYRSAVLGLSRLSRVPDVMFKACVAAQGWPCSRNVLLAFPFLSLHMNVIVPNFGISVCSVQIFSLVKLHLGHPQPLSFRGSKEVTNLSHPLSVFARKDKCKLVKTEDYS